jgi:hypothetical protein
LNILRRLSLTVLLIGTASCDPGISAHIEAGATRDSLVIHAFAARDSVVGGGILDDLSVARCEIVRGSRPVVWHVFRADPSFRQSTETRFLYGKRPADDWRGRQTADPLTPGCYEVSATGSGITGYVWFMVDSSGRVREFRQQP